MYEPYLNREKQYLKVNAELDSRFKEIDPLKWDTTGDVVKPRLNVFGNGSKVNQSIKSVVHCPKQKKNEFKSGTTPNVTLDQNNLGVAENLVKRVDTNVHRAQKSKVAASSRLSQENLPERKSSPVQVSQGNQSQIHGLSNNAAMSPTINDTTTVKKNISSEGLIK